MLISTNSGLHSAVPGRERISMFEAMGFFKRMGFDAVDVNFCASIYTNEFKHDPILDGDNWRDTVKRLKEEIDRVGLVVSHTHLPFFDYGNRDHDDYGMRVEMMNRAIEASAIIGAKWAVVHPSKGEGDDATFEKSIKELSGWLSDANDRGVGFAVENMYLTPYELIIRIVDEFRSQGLNAGICWDTGHGNRRKINQYEAVTAIGERLKVLHIHDNFAAGDDHLPPPFGNIVWEDFYRGLRDIGYTGTFNYEVSLARLPLESREEIVRYLVKTARLMVEKIGL